MPRKTTHILCIHVACYFLTASAFPTICNYAAVSSGSGSSLFTLSPQRYRQQPRARYRLVNLNLDGELFHAPGTDKFNVPYLEAQDILDAFRIAHPQVAPEVTTVT